MNVDVALEALGKGPRNGNLENPKLSSAARRAHFTAETLPDGSPAFHNSKPWHDTASKGVQKECYWHRMAAYMLNAGRTNSEIAAAAQVHVNTISQLRAQRWFQEFCATIANSDGEEVLGAIRSHVLPSVERLADLAENSENERVRLAANIALIEQGHGKPVQKTVSFVASTSFSSPADEMEQIREELKALRAQSPEILEAEVSVK